MHRNDLDAKDALPVRWACRPPLRRANPNARDSRQCGPLARSPLPLIPSPSGEGTGAVSLPGVASGPAGQCLSCDDRRTELRQTKNQVLEEVREDERMK